MNLKLNGLYREYLDYVGEQTSNNPELLHSLMWDKFLSKRHRITINGKIKYTRIKQSTTKLSDEEFSKYFENVQNYFNIPLPSKDDPDFFNINL